MFKVRKRLFVYLFCAVLFLFANFLSISFAHEMGEGTHIQVDLRPQFMSMQVEITLQELVAIFDIDANDDGKLLGEEYALVDTQKLAGYVIEHLKLEADRRLCRLEITSHEIVAHSTGDFIRFPIVHNCSKPDEQLIVKYHLFFDENPYHQGTLTVIQSQHSSLSYFWDDQRTHVLRLQNVSQLKMFYRDLQLGFRHILIGLDHLLFLLCLILPSVLILKKHDVKGKGYSWVPASSLLVVMIDIAKVVTAFTVAHSVTLGLSVMEWVPQPPPALVEIVIAVTVLLVALNNLIPVVYRLRWFVTLLLGLIHGFGFANVLNAYELPVKDIGWSLLAFNLGVEIGQLLCVGAVLPLLYWLRKSVLYVALALKGGSVAVIIVACGWIVQRAC